MFSSYDGPWYEPWNWSVPYYDGRAQLKQNLSFVLREPLSTSFNYVYGGFFNAAPTGYGCVGLYKSDPPDFFETSEATNVMDELLPFEENYFYQNLAFSVDALNSYGEITTGFQDGDAPAEQLTLQSSLTYQFQEPTGPTNIPALLTTNDAQWLLGSPDAPSRDRDTLTNGVYYDLASMGITYTYDSDVYEWEFTLSGGVVNYFGLPIQSVELAYLLYTNEDYGGVLVTNTLNAGNSVTLGIGTLPFCYAGTEQPKYLTLGYNFGALAGPILVIIITRFTFHTLAARFPAIQVLRRQIKVTF